MNTTRQGLDQKGSKSPRLGSKGEQQTNNRTRPARIREQTNKPGIAGESHEPRISAGWKTRRKTRGKDVDKGGAVGRENRGRGKGRGRGRGEKG